MFNFVIVDMSCNILKMTCSETDQNKACQILDEQTVAETEGIKIYGCISYRSNRNVCFSLIQDHVLEEVVTERGIEFDTKKWRHILSE